MEDKESIFSDLETTEVESSYLQRVLINLIDWVIEILLLVSIYFFIPKEVILNLLTINPYSKYIIVLVVLLSYRLICILLFSKTIGMMICKVKYLNAGLQPLSSKEKMIAVFATRTAAIRYYKAS
jgi:uncharacterized RDD family membrane protein YckC